MALDGFASTYLLTTNVSLFVLLFRGIRERPSCGPDDVVRLVAGDRLRNAELLLTHAHRD